LAVALILLIAGCGDDSTEKTTAAEKKGPVPASLRTVESASEDIIDLALAGKRDEVVQKAKRLDAAAKEEPGGDLKTRAARVAKLAPSAPLLEVALASNQVFALVPGLFAQYETTVPATVTELDYLDFEAKLESRANDRAKLRRAVTQLRTTWDSLRADVPSERAAANFEAHVKSIEQLAGNTDPEKTQREAQHGLDLVDELEQSFEN
jgi:hypothetical protein